MAIYHAYYNLETTDEWVERMHKQWDTKIAIQDAKYELAKATCTTSLLLTPDPKRAEELRAEIQRLEAYLKSITYDPSVEYGWIDQIESK